MLARHGEPRHDVRGAGDRQLARRLAIAFAASIALHEVAAGFVPPERSPQAADSVVVARLVSLSRRARPTPTPKPTPHLTPPPAATPAPQSAVKAPAAKAAATPNAALGGAAAHRRILVRKPRPLPPSAPPVAIVNGTHSGQQNGGTGAGAGPGSGTSGLGGTGSGTGTSGTGNGGDATTACGQVDLEPGRVDYRPDGTVLQYVIAKVTTVNDVEVGRFPYPFVYPAERLNPFSHLDVKLAEDGGVPVQTPPPGLDQSTLLPAVAFVLKYTDPTNGHTTLPPCPAPSP